MPDFDVDFDDRRRGEVIEYVTEKYGAERVAQIVDLRHHQVQAGAEGRRAACSATRSAWATSSPRRCRRAVHGQGHPARRTSSDPEHKRYNDGRRVPRAHTRPTPKSARRLRDGARPRGPEAPVGRARRRRDHVQPSRLLDIVPIMRRGRRTAQVITQFDYPTCESLGLIKMDFLGLSQPHASSRDALDNIKAQQRTRTLDLEDLPLDDRGDLRAAGPRRHPRRVPARRRPHAVAAAARCSPTTSTTSRPSARCTARARWAPTRTTTYALPQERPRADRRRSTRSSTSRWSTILGETYGLIVYQEQVMAIAQQVLAGFTLGAGRHPAPRDGQEEEVRAGQAVRRLPGRHARATATPQAGDRRRSGTSCSRSPTTPSTSRTPRPTASSPTGPPTSRRNYPTEYMAALLTSRRATTRTRWRSTSTSAAG